MSDPAFSDLFPKADAAAWRARALAALKGADFDKALVSRTHDGIAVQPIYPAARDAATAPARQGPWRIVQRVDMPERDAAAAQALADLAGGADALALVFGASAFARGHGLDIDSIDDLDQALAGVRLDLIDIRLEPAAGGRLNAALLAALAAKRGHDPAALSTAFGIDPIGVLATLGSFAAGWPEISRRVGESVGALSARGFRGPFLLADGRPWHEAGASEGQELAAVLATGVAYLRALEGQGHALDAARGALSFLLVADTGEFLTIAKFRALRRLWARVEDACGIAPKPIRLDAETAWRSLTKRDPHVNMLRSAIAAFSAGIGGADSVAVLPFTAALGLPDAFARRLARNAQLILMEESHLAKVADPAAGAGGFEALTEALCETAWALFQEIEREGGIVESLAAGRLQARIAATRAARAKAIATRREPLTGTSEFPQLAEAPVAVMQVSPPVARPPKARRGGGRLDFAGLIDAFAAGASRREMAPAAQETIRCEKLPSLRLAEPFEELRDRSDAVLAASGRRPRVALIGLGRLADHTARLGFARSFFEAGGIEAIATETDSAILAGAFAATGTSFACLCGSDAAYRAEAEAAAQSLRAAGARHVWLAGRPGEAESSFREAGVDGFIFSGCDALVMLRQTHELLERGS
jgi:methylmalonyl-CoA mutase